LWNFIIHKEEIEERKRREREDKKRRETEERYIRERKRDKGKIFV